MIPPTFLKRVMTWCTIVPLSLTSSYAAVINLTDIVNNTSNNTPTSTAELLNTSTNTTYTGTAGELGGAYFIGGSTGSGAGGSRAIYRLKSNKGTEAGYNRPNVFNSNVLGGNSHIITVADLVSTSDGQYYIFSLDINEGGIGRVSMDEFRIYTGAQDPATLPTTEANLGNLGTLRYNMNATEQNHVLIQSAASGSGTSDLFVFVPVVNLQNAASTDQVYLYTAFGEFKYTGEANNSNTWGVDSGDEEWSIPSAADQRPTITPSPTTSGPMIPEPSSSFLLLTGAFSFLLRRRR